MPRVTCRCGQTLSVPVNGPERVVCPQCQSRIRVRRDALAGGGAGAAAGPAGDGYVRFACTCGRRLKVRTGDLGAGPQAGKCPDCGRSVALPAGPGLSGTDPEVPTEELTAADLVALERWSQEQINKSGDGGGTDARGRAAAATTAAPPADPDPPADTAPVVPVRVEAGLRVCPRCGRPVHLSATTCRDCGVAVPKR